MDSSNILDQDKLLSVIICFLFFFFQAEDGIRDAQESRGLGDVYKRQSLNISAQEIDIAKGKSLFNANCASCHKLNKNLVGPALKGVSAKYDKDWLCLLYTSDAADE